jgi:hypothetical protein
MSDDIVLGAKQIKNPKGITPKLDTENPDLPKRKYVNMDTSNPPTSQLIPKHPVEDLFEMKGIRQQPGHSVPKNHPAIQVSEN